jgi:hypothetical protein
MLVERHPIIAKVRLATVIRQPRVRCGVAELVRVQVIHAGSESPALQHLAYTQQGEPFSLARSSQGHEDDAYMCLSRGHR